MKWLWWAVPLGAVGLFFAFKDDDQDVNDLSNFTPFDPNQKKILLIGDSLSASKDSPGGQLAQLFEAAGATVERNGVGARSFTSFLGGKGVKTAPEPGAAAEQVKSALPFDLALILLGTNDNANVAVSKDFEAAKDRVQGSIRNVLALFGDERVIWLGPPMFGPNVKAAAGGVPLQQTEDALFPQLVPLFEEVLDNRPLTKDLLTTAEGRSGDGIHFKGSGAKVWAKRMFDRLTGES